MESPTRFTVETGNRHARLVRIYDDVEAPSATSIRQPDRSRLFGICRSDGPPGPAPNGRRTVACQPGGWTSRFVSGTNVPTCSSASPSVSPASSTHAWARNSALVRSTPTRTVAPLIPRFASMRESATERTRHCGRNTPNRAARTIASASRRASGNREASAGATPVTGVAKAPIGRDRTSDCATRSAHWA